MNKISITILTKDSSIYIKECLKALVKFDEIIIYYKSPLGLIVGNKITSFSA